MLEFLADLIGRIFVEVIFYAMILYPGAAVLRLVKQSKLSLSKTIDNNGIICFLIGVGIWIGAYFAISHLISSS